MESGVLAWKVGSEMTAKFVLKVTSRGFVSWGVTMSKKHTLAAVTFSSDFRAAVDAHVVDNPGGWKVLPLRCVSPASAAWPEGAAVRGLVWIAEGKSQHLLPFAAARGFRNLSHVQLQWVNASLPPDQQVVGSSTLTDDEFTRALVARHLRRS